jgi:hypothetical protein
LIAALFGCVREGVVGLVRLLSIFICFVIVVVDVVDDNERTTIIPPRETNSSIEDRKSR